MSANQSNNAAFFNSILKKQAFQASNLPKTSTSTVNTFEQLDQYCDYFEARQESNSRSISKIQSPFYLKMSVDDIEVLRKELPEHIRRDREDYLEDQKMESEVEPFDSDSKEHLWLKPQGGIHHDSQNFAPVNNHVEPQPEVANNRESRLSNPVIGATSPVFEEPPRKEISNRKTVERNVKPEPPNIKPPEPRMRRQRRSPGELYVGQAYEFVAVARLSKEKPANDKRVRIPTTRYWCDRPVYVKGQLKGVLKRQFV